jgi:RND family efflux transporter MFP subunit
VSTADVMGQPTPQGRRNLYVIGILFVLCGAGYSVLTYTQRRAAAAASSHRLQEKMGQGPQILVVPAGHLGGPRMVTLPGDVRAIKQITLYAKVSGYLKTINVDKGDNVKIGQVLGVVESPETDDQVLAAQADLRQKTLVETRYKGLVGKGVVSAQEMEKAHADVESATADVARLQALQDYEIIRAPFSGVVTARYADPGALLPAATGTSQNVQPLIDLVDMTRMRILVSVGQAEAPYIHAGDMVEISGDAQSPLERNAPITRVARSIDPRTRTMLAEIDLDNKQGELAPGLFVHVVMHIKPIGGLTIPADTVVIRDGKTQVPVVRDNQVSYRVVRLGDHDGMTVRVLDGVREGELLGRNLGDEISDGAKVQPVRRDGQALLPEAAKP